MYILDLYFTRILPTRTGIMAYAKYLNWREEFSFLLQPDGKVRGKNSHGLWLELSQEFSSLIKSKIQSLLIERSELVCA